MEATVIDHPLCDDTIAIPRDRKTPGILFRSVFAEPGPILAVECTRHLPTEPVALETPLEPRHHAALDPVGVPVLRAGLGLLSSFLQLLPTAQVGHRGLFRDRDSLVPVPCHRNVPPLLDQRPAPRKRCPDWRPPEPGASPRPPRPPLPRVWPVSGRTTPAPGSSSR